jgi:hypothetical protein
MTDAVEKEVHKPVVIYSLMVHGSKIGEFTNEMELAMAVSRFCSFNKENDSEIQIEEDGKIVYQGKDYWSLKLADLFIFANKTLADLNVLGAQVRDLQVKYKALEESLKPKAEEAVVN